MGKSLPAYLKNFTCYLLRVQFSAQKEVEIKESWFHLPSYALGDALMNSKNYKHLYNTLFKPTQGRFKNIPSRIIVRADGTKRSKFSKNEILNLYVTIVSNDRQEIIDFINFLPEWSHFHFFKNYSFRFHSSYLLNPLSNEFEPSRQSDIKPLDYNFFNDRLVKWKDRLEIRFLTPTSYLKDQLLTEEVSYNELIKRVENRVFNLYFSFLAPTEEIDENYSFVADTEAVTLFNGVSFPKQMIIKKKKYNLSGLKGFICYSVPYNYEDDYLLTLAYYIHVGNNTVRGNGQIEAIACKNNLFAKYINELRNSGVAEEIIEKIENHAYIPSTYRSIKIPKSDGTYRELEIPTPEDIMLQKAMASVLYPAIDKKLSYQNFAYRKGKGALAAINQVQKWIKSHSDTHSVIRCDIDDFFDTISVPSLLKKLYSTVQDPAICHLVALWISSGKINSKNQYEENRNGIPQGSAVSPLLANLYLAEFDQFIENKITKRFIRYADDILLLVPKEEKIIRILQMLTDYLEANLQLNLNQEFYAGSLKDSFSFLGIEFEGNGKLNISNDKKTKIDDKIKLALWLADEGDFSDLEKTVQGLKNYYGKLLTTEDKQTIDDIIVEVYRTYLQGISKPDIIAERITLLTQIGFITDKYADGKWGKQIKPKKEKKVPKPGSVTESLKIQKRKHLQAQAEECELVVTLPGSFIGISKNKIQVKKGGKTVTSKPINNIRQISILSEGITISSYVTKYCAKKEIQIAYFDSHGKVYATLNNPDTILPENMEAQMLLSDEKKSLFVAELVKNKTQNQLKLLKYYAKYHRKKKSSISDVLENCINDMNIKYENFPCEESYEQLCKKLFLWEAQFALIYWRGVRALLSETEYPFAEREYQNATGIVNQMLNYGYALLESKVMRTIHTWQLNPNISYLHAMNDNDPTLCFDLMEQYRTFVVDRSVIAIIAKGEKIAQEKNSGLLTLDTRKKLISKINERWFTVETYKGKEILLSELMHKLMEQFLSFCKGDVSKPKFYNPKW